MRSVDLEDLWDELSPLIVDGCRGDARDALVSAWPSPVWDDPDVIERMADFLKRFDDDSAYADLMTREGYVESARAALRVAFASKEEGET